MKGIQSRAGRLLALFSVSALISLAVILTLTYFGIRLIYQDNVMEMAKRQAVSVGRALYVQERSLLTGGSTESGGTLAVREADFPRLDRRMRQYLQPFNIIKIKAFARDAEIVYSTDPNVVGQHSVGNERLAQALDGHVVAELASEGRIVDVSNETRFDVDVVEAYLPVRNRDGGVVGSFEVYLDVTRHQAQLSRIVGSSMLVIGAILVVTFGALFALMRRGTAQLRDYEVQLRTMAVTDRLTGIPNRRHVIDRAEEEFARLQRLGPPEKRLNNVGCIMIDIDYFKPINDTYGHAAGDAVLKDIADRINRATRQYDLVGRYGGEEFLVMAPHTELAQTECIADRIWRAVREKPCAYGSEFIDVTISLGVTATLDADRSVDDTIQRADRGLYQAKESGRDRVTVVETSNGGDEGVQDDVE